MLTKNIILAVGRHDTLKPLDIKYMLFENSVHDTNTINGVEWVIEV
jgi:hypothetical protein